MTLWEVEIYIFSKKNFKKWEIMWVCYGFLKVENIEQEMLMGRGEHLYWKYLDLIV